MSTTSDSCILLSVAMLAEVIMRAPSALYVPVALIPYDIWAESMSGAHAKIIGVHMNIIMKNKSLI